MKASRGRAMPDFLSVSVVAAPLLAAALSVVGISASANTFSVDFNATPVPIPGWANLSDTTPFRGSFKYDTSDIVLGVNNFIIITDVKVFAGEHLFVSNNSSDRISFCDTAFCSSFSLNASFLYGVSPEVSMRQGAIGFNFNSLPVGGWLNPKANMASGGSGSASLGGISGNGLVWLSDVSLTVSAIPEPSTYLLLLTGAPFLLRRIRRG